MSYLGEMAAQGYRMEAIGDFHRFMLPWLLECHGIDRADTVLDIGAGHGHCLVPLHDGGWRKLVALDVDPRNFAEFAATLGIESLLCDISRERIALDDGAVGAVICFHVIEHLPAPDNLLTECCRVLRPGGRLFLVTPDWRKQYRTFWRDPTHLRPYDKEAIARLFRMHGLEPRIHSWGSRLGLGRLHAYRLWPALGMIGADLLAIGTRPPGGISRNG